MLVLSFVISGSAMAQQKLTKVSQSIKVNKDVKINLNTSNCNVVFDTWNKNVVEIEAYIEGEQLSNDELQDALKLWGIDIDASTDNVSIRTTGNERNVWVYRTKDYIDDDAVQAVLKEMQFELADVVDFDFDMQAEMPEYPPMPPMPPMAPMPELPELPHDIHKIKFDYEAYKRDGDKYLKDYTRAFDIEYGEDFAKKMEAWGEKFGKKWGDKYGKKMEEWAKKIEEKYGSEEYAEKMEAWGERYAEHAEHEAARREAHADHRAHAIEYRLEEQEMRRTEREMLLKERQQKIEEMVHGTSKSKVKKTIKIKMPKSAKLKIDVRHGEVEFASNIDNLQADLAYTKLIANSIDGSLTSINASYSPVYITNWVLGELNLNYVEKVELTNVNHLILNASSSNIKIENLIKSAIIDGNIGDLTISNIDNDFSSLNVILQNSNAIINLPKVAYSFQYKGVHTRFSHPEKTSKENTSNFTSGNTASSKSIVVNAKYSNIKIQ